MYALEITPEDAGWGFCGLRILPLGGAHAFDTGEDELIVLPLEGGARGDRRRRVLHAAGPRRRVRRPDRLRLRPARRARGDRRRRAASRCRRRARGNRLEPKRVEDVAVELRGAGQMSRQINNFCGPDTDFADRLIAVEVITPGGNWSSLSAAQARRGHPRRRDRARGDLLLRGRRRRLRLPARLRAGDRHPRGGPQRRPRAAAQRLPRPVDGRARLRPLLPQRDGRARRARVALHRRPGARLDPGLVGGPGDRPAAADEGGTHEADGRPGAGAVPREPVHRARRRRAAADRRLLRHLRPRQRRRRRPGAARAARGDALRARAQRAGDGPRRGRLRAPAATASRPTPAPPRSAPARRTWSPAPRSRRSTACRCCCCRATSSPRASPSPVLQELEDPSSLDVSVNDCFKPVSRFWDRINRARAAAARPLLAAMRVLTDPAETGAVTLSLPQDVQAEAFDWPEEFFARRVWHVRRPPAEPERLAEAAELLRGARRPLIVCRRRHDLRRGDRRAARSSPRRPAIPVAETQAGKGSLPYDHPQSLGAIGATGTTAANAIAREADVVLGVGTRWSDFTTASRSLFADPGVRFVNLNVAPGRRLQARRAAAGGRRARRPRGAARRARGLERRRRPHASAPAASPPSGTRRSSAPTRSATRRCRPRAR